MWTQNSAGIAGIADAHDSFGDHMVSGRFSGRPYDDLAINVFAEGVQVLYGSPTGLQPAGSQFWSRNGRTVSARAGKKGVGFTALATGNLGKDNYGQQYDELVVGSPHHGSGDVHVLHGSEGGLSASRINRLTQDSWQIAGASEDLDEFGSALAIGDFGNNGNVQPYADLAIGVAGDLTGKVKESGAMNLIYGSASGLTPMGNQLWNHTTIGGKLKLGYWLTAG